MTMRLPTRRPLLAVAIIVLAATIAIGAAVAAAVTNTPAGGTFHFFGVSKGLGDKGKTTVIGAIGDSGSSKATNHGNDINLMLSQGTILLDKSRFDKAVARAFNQAAVNKATCSVYVSATGSLPILSGTGLYAGIGGSARATLSAGFVLPRLSSGKCDESNNARPKASVQVVEGTGQAHFK